MFLRTTTTKSGRLSLSCVYSYRDEHGKGHQKTIQTFGFVDELEKIYPDPIEHFRGVVKEMEAARKAEVAKRTPTIYPKQKINMKKSLSSRRHVGAAPIVAWLDALGFESQIRNALRLRKLDFNVYAVLRLLVCEHILHPASKFASLTQASRYFFKTDIEVHDLYRALDELASLADKLVLCANRSIEKRMKRDDVLLCYDVTNYYFETDPAGLRQSGVSKEGRKNPIVQMGLLQDLDGIPIAFDLFSGNTPDCQTLIPVLGKQKSIHNRRIVVVADKGMNASDNIIATLARGNGFVFSQSLRGTLSDALLKTYALDDSGYRVLDNGTFKIKSKCTKKRIKIKAEDAFDGKEKFEEIDVKVVCFWSQKYERRARHDRQKTIDRAYDLIAHPSAYTQSTHFGAAKYIKNITFDKKSGEVIERADKALSFDIDALRKDEALDGYYVIVTSETTWTEDQIIEAYRELWRIEEAFRITKTQGISSRPVYVWTDEHIRAHFLICYISLLIVRLMQLALPEHVSAKELIESLRKVDCSYEGDNWWLFDYRSDITEAIFSQIGDDHPTMHMQTSQIKKYFSKNKSITWPKSHYKK